MAEPTPTRFLAPDFTFRYQNGHHQIERSDAELRMPGSRITIERRLDGSTRYRWREGYLKATPLSSERARQPPAPKEVQEPITEPSPPTPPR